jgi:hypothetical protein
MEIMQSIQALSAVISIKFASLPDVDLGHVHLISLIADALARDTSCYFSKPDSIVKIQNALKYLAPDIPLLAPAALNWALTMHRFFTALTEENEELPTRHSDTIVTYYFLPSDLDATI